MLPLTVEKVVEALKTSPKTIASNMKDDFTINFFSIHFDGSFSVRTLRRGQKPKMYTFQDMQEAIDFFNKFEV